MKDKFSKEKRSEIMRSVKSRYNVSTELKLIQFFRANNITGWRRNYKLQGKPDFVFPKKKVGIFTDGCFWHGHICKNLKPANNRSYWVNKIRKNQIRDTEITLLLRMKGWNIIRVWECELKKEVHLKRKFQFLKNNYLDT